MSTPPPNINIKIIGSNDEIAKNPVLQQLARLLHTHTLRCAFTLDAYLEVLKSPLSTTHIVNDRTHAMHWLDYLKERGDPRGLETSGLVPPLPNREDVKDALSEFPEIALKDFTAGQETLNQSCGFTIKTDDANRIYFREDLAAELERATEFEVHIFASPS